MGVALPAPTVIVDAWGKRRLGQLTRSLSDVPTAGMCVSSDPWLLAADVRHAVDDGSSHFLCFGGDEAWLAACAGSSGSSEIVISHGGGPAGIPRNFGLPPEPDRNAKRLVAAERDLVPLDTIFVAPDAGPAVEVANGVWVGFGRRAGLWARTLGSWRLGLVVGGTSLYREHLVLSMGSVQRETMASGVYIANGQFLGELSMVPQAHPGDAKLDVLVFEGSARDIWPVIPRLAAGTHLPHPRITELHPETLRIEGRGRLLADGHDIGRLPVSLDICPARLYVAV